MQVLRVDEVEPRVHEKLAKSVTRKAGLLDQLLDRCAICLVCFKLEEAEEGDGVVLGDPQLLSSDELRDLGRKGESPYLGAVEPECREIVNDGIPGLVAVHLLGNVALQICGETRGDWVRRREVERALESRFHQRDHRSRYVIRDRQKRRVQLACARVMQQEIEGCTVRGKGELDFPGEMRARGQLDLEPRGSDRSSRVWTSVFRHRPVAA